jgi:hypothetical protein
MEPYTVQLTLQSSTNGSSPEYLLTISRVNAEPGVASTKSLATLDEAIDNLRLIRFTNNQLNHIRTGMNASAGWCVVERVLLSGEDFRNLQMRDLK